MWICIYTDVAEVAPERLACYVEMLDQNPNPGNPHTLPAAHYLFSSYLDKKRCLHQSTHVALQLLQHPTTPSSSRD